MRVMGGTPHTGSTDGRTLRRARNRDAVLDAVIEIFEEGDIDPSVDSVAERAGVSNRSIYRYFDHRDHLMRAAVTHAMRRVIPEIQLDAVGVGFVRGTSRALRRSPAPDVSAAWRPSPGPPSGRAQSEPIIREEFEAGRLVLRRSFLDHFADEFASLGPAERTQAVLTAELAVPVRSVRIPLEIDQRTGFGDADDSRRAPHVVPRPGAVVHGQLKPSTGRFCRIGVASRAVGRAMVLTKGNGRSQVHPRGPDRRAAGLRVARPRPRVLDARPPG